MHNTPDDDIKFTRRDLLKKTVSGPLLAGSVGSVALTGLVNALVPNGGDSSYFPKCGFIQEIYAEPVDLDHPHTISIKTVHMRLYSQLTMAVQGTWRFSLNFSRMVPYPKKDNGELLFVNTIEVLGEFPGSPASASPGSRDTWTKKNIALSGWESIKKFSIAELHALNNGLWYITVDFMAHGNSPTTPTGAEPWIYVAESHFTPSYGIQVAPNSVAPDSDKLPKNREQPQDLWALNERKYGSTAIVLAEPRYTGVGDNVDKLVALDGADAFAKVYDRLVIGFAHFGHRTDNDWSAGLYPPAPVPEPNPNVTARVKGGVHESAGRCYWQIHAVSLTYRGMAIPSVSPQSLNFSNIVTWSSTGGDFKWEGSHAWSFPQSNAEAGQGFNGAGEFVTNKNTSERLGWRPATANSVLVKQGAANANPSKVELTRVACCAWKQVEGGTFMASAVCAPGFYSTQDGNGAPWVLYPVPSGTPVVQPHSDNKILHEPVGPALVCGPGLFTSWDNPDRSEHGTMQAGFWWQVFDGANPTGEIITDHDPDRVWRNKFQFIIIGPEDTGGVK